MSEGYNAPFVGIIKSGECHVLRQVEVLHTLPNGEKVGPNTFYIFQTSFCFILLNITVELFLYNDSLFKMDRIGI